MNMTKDNLLTPYGVCQHTKYEGSAPCIHDAYLRGYAEAEKKYTNDCFICGYAGEWSTWTCEDCELEEAKQ
jgi:hypothetical protein